MRCCFGVLEAVTEPSSFTVVDVSTMLPSSSVTVFSESGEDADSESTEKPIAALAETLTSKPALTLSI